VSRHNLTDREWKSIRVFLPAERSGRAGRPWKPHRQVINGIFFILRTGIAWEDLPTEFGKFKTVYNRFRRWVKSGLWQRIFERLIARLLGDGEIDFELWCVDGTVIRAHKAAAGAKKGELTTEENAAKQALGRSRGGYSTKLHLLTDGQGIPLAVTATPGQRNEGPEFSSLMDACLINMFRKANRPTAIAADKAYNTKEIRAQIKKLEIQDVIPKKSNQIQDPNFDKTTYKLRNIVERLIGWTKENRRIATRYEKIIDNYLAMVHIAITRMIINWD
jgi:transposase